MCDRGRILNLNSAEIKRGSMRGNLRGAMEKVEGDERPREKKERGGGGVRGSKRNRAERETKRSERT